MSVGALSSSSYSMNDYAHSLLEQNRNLARALNVEKQKVQLLESQICEINRSKEFLSFKPTVNATKDFHTHLLTRCGDIMNLVRSTIASGVEASVAITSLMSDVKNSMEASNKITFQARVPNQCERLNGNKTSEGNRTNKVLPLLEGKFLIKHATVKIMKDSHLQNQENRCSVVVETSNHAVEEPDAGTPSPQGDGTSPQQSEVAETNQTSADRLTQSRSGNLSTIVEYTEQASTSFLPSTSPAVISKDIITNFQNIPTSTPFSPACNVSISKCTTPENSTPRSYVTNRRQRKLHRMSMPNNPVVLLQKIDNINILNAPEESDKNVKPSRTNDATDFTVDSSEQELNQDEISMLPMLFDGPSTSTHFHSPIKTSSKGGKNRGKENINKEDAKKTYKTRKSTEKMPGKVTMVLPRNSKRKNSAATDDHSSNRRSSECSDATTSIQSNEADGTRKSSRNKKVINFKEMPLNKKMRRT